MEKIFRQVIRFFLIVERSRSSRGYNGRAYNNKWVTDVQRSFGNFVCNILPLPPDIRKVEIKSQDPPMRVASLLLPEPQQQQRVQQQQATHSKICISGSNTTLIGDYISAVFQQFDSHWLVQATGNATFESTFNLVCEEALVVRKRYIFLQLGGNEVRSATKEKLFKQVLTLIVAIRERNPKVRIFLIGVLLRPIEDKNVKHFVVMFNCWLHNAADRIDAIFQNKIRFLPVQLSFLQSDGPKLFLFNEDKLKLNQAGVEVFRRAVFQLAGFVKKQQ